MPVITHGPGSGHPASCFGCRVKTVRVAPSAMPSRHPGVQAINDRETDMDKDLPAYKRLRKQGYQPQTTRGSADLERKAEHPAEITMGKRLSPDARVMAEEMGV